MEMDGAVGVFLQYFTERIITAIRTTSPAAPPAMAAIGSFVEEEVLVVELPPDDWGFATHFPSTRLY